MSAVQSPLFEPVLWQGRGFRILDETPASRKNRVYRSARSRPGARRGARDENPRLRPGADVSLQRRAAGAAAIRTTTPAPLRRAAGGNDATVLRGSTDLRFSRPGFIFRSVVLRIATGQAMPENAIAQQAREFGAANRRGRAARAPNARCRVLPDPARVLTHCNVSGELVAVAQLLQRSGQRIFRHRHRNPAVSPGRAPDRLGACPSGRGGVGHPGLRRGQVMAQGEVNAVIVGADRAAQNGDIINKVGTYPLALMAKEYGVPFHALVQDPRSLATRQRRGDRRTAGRRVADLSGTAVGADSNARCQACVIRPSIVTPAALITHLIGFDDLYTPETFRRKYQKQSSSSDEPRAKQQRQIRACLRRAAKKSVCVPCQRAQSRAGRKRFGSRNAAAALGRASRGAGAVGAQCAGDSDFRQHDGNVVRAGRDRQALPVLRYSLTEAGPSGICGSLLARALARCTASRRIVQRAISNADRLLTTTCRRFLGKSICPAGVIVPRVEAEVIPWALLKNLEE